MFSKDSSFEPNQPNKTAAVEGVRESVLKFLKFCSLECLLLSKPTSSLGPECGWSFSVQVGTCPRRTLSVRKTHFSEDTTLKKYVVLRSKFCRPTVAISLERRWISWSHFSSQSSKRTKEGEVRLASSAMSDKLSNREGGGLQWERHVCRIVITRRAKLCRFRCGDPQRNSTTCGPRRSSNSA